MEQSKTTNLNQSVRYTLTKNNLRLNVKTFESRQYFKWGQIPWKKLKNRLTLHKETE